MHTQTNEEAEFDEKERERETETEKELLRADELDQFEDKLCSLPPRPKMCPGSDGTARSLPEKTRACRPHDLPLSQQTIRGLASPDDDKLPSPSTASLKLLPTPMAPELSNKSSSAPVIMKKPATLGRNLHEPEEDAKKKVIEHL